MASKAFVPYRIRMTPSAGMPGFSSIEGLAMATLMR
jgi:hypothetical protein